MLGLMKRQQFTRKRYPTISDHGSTVTDYTAAPVITTFWGSVQPGAGSEDVVNRNGFEIVQTIFASNPEVDVHDQDLIGLPDGDFQVNGEPERWRTGTLNHAVIHLSVWKG